MESIYTPVSYILEVKLGVCLCTVYASRTWA